MSTVTLIMPFDTGRSYSMPPGFRWDQHLTTDDLNSGWAPANLPTHIEQPLGEPVRLRIEHAELRAAESAAGWLASNFELEAVFFPVGIGILLLRGQLVGTGQERWQSRTPWQSEAYARYESIARSVSQSFARLAERRGLLELHGVGRGAVAPEIPWIFPLFFLDPATVSVPDTEVIENRLLDGASIAIRWTGADIGLTTSADRAEIEWFFVVASVTWQSLFIIDDLLSQFLAELDYPSSKRKQADRTNEVRQVRLFCKRVVDGSRTLRWTIVRGGVELLEGIHVAWSTSQMWQSIDDKTSLLVLMHEQQEEEAREATGTLVGYVALLIAIGSTVSAVADFFTFVDPEGTILPPGWKRGAAAILPSFIIGAITVILLGLHRHRKGLRS